MKLTEAESANRLAAHDHGVLSTLNPDRGVDSVPVVYGLIDGFVGVPIDQVKPKASTRLQRAQNLETDPRASLLIEHWDRHDWSQLWWVRAELQYEAESESVRAPALAARLSETFEQYQNQPFASLLVLRIVGISGWSAS